VVDPMASLPRVLALEDRVSLLEPGLDAARAEAARLRTEPAAARAGQFRSLTMERNGDDR
jgi:hypothetical protein